MSLRTTREVEFSLQMPNGYFSAVAGRRARRSERLEIDFDPERKRRATNLVALRILT